VIAASRGTCSIGVEIRTIGGEELQSCANGLDGLTHSGLFVGRQIIHHDDVARSQRWGENLFDVALEQVAVAPQLKGRGGRERPPLRGVAPNRTPTRSSLTGPRA
jgi:hypothetical protein